MLSFINELYLTYHSTLIRQKRREDNMFLKKEIFKAILFKNPVRLPLSYWILVFIRFLLTLLPQRGYIHPDEYFQNIEIIAGL